MVTAYGEIGYDSTQSCVVEHPCEVRRSVTQTSALALPDREIWVMKEMQSASLYLLEQKYLPEGYFCGIPTLHDASKSPR